MPKPPGPLNPPHTNQRACAKRFLIESFPTFQAASPLPPNVHMPHSLTASSGPRIEPPEPSPRLGPPVPNVLYRNKIAPLQNDPQQLGGQPRATDLQGQPPMGSPLGETPGGQLGKQPRATNLLGLVKHRNKYTDVW